MRIICEHAIHVILHIITKQKTYLTEMCWQLLAFSPSSSS